MNGTLKIQIHRFKNNPLIKPDTKYPWKSGPVFNPGVAKFGNGYIMLFRAANPKRGDILESSLGIAKSSNGKQWFPGKQPIPEMTCGYREEFPLGVEDPRIIKWIDEYYYIFASVTRPENHRATTRVGLWRTKDFKHFSWLGILLDELGENRNTSVIPEPIKGYAWLIHRVGQKHLWISKSRDLSLNGQWTDHKVLVTPRQFYKSIYTDSLPVKIGLAGPPLKTKGGWLVFVHVVHMGDKELFGRTYSLGFMVLDLENPRKVIYIHPEPILTPKYWYELYGITPNVVFSCGAVDINEKYIYVYYGGADTFVCGGYLKKSDLPMCY